MERGVYRFILRYSLRDQILLVLMSASALPFLYLTLELPKTIVNQAIGGTDFPRHVLGHDLGQIPYLLLLCGLFLTLVIISGALKYFTSTYRYRVGDRLLRRLRYELIERVLRFPTSEFHHLSSGQIVSMITAETSNLGFFIAEAFAVPAVAIGTLGTIMLFMFMQNWMMGVAAIAMYPIQIYIVPKIQRQINELQRKEVKEQRDISRRIGDVVAGAKEIHGHDTSQYELADFSERLGTVYEYRVKISSKRYLTNVLNQFFSQLTPFFFLSIGGYLVIVGEISLGALVAVLAAYKDMYAPWKDIIDYYQKAEDARVRFDQLKEVFAHGTLLDKSIIEAEPEEADFSGLSLVAENVVVEKEEGVRLVDGATVNLPLPLHTAVLGSGGSGREEFARLLARREFPRSGTILLGDRNLSQLPDSITGRRIGYVSANTYLGSGSLREVLVYPLLRRPRIASDIECSPSPARQKIAAERLRAGNSPFDFETDWIDYRNAGCADRDALDHRMIDVLGMVNLDQHVFDMGLRQCIDPARHPELAARVVEAREIFLARLRATNRDTLVERFDVHSFNAHASIAENILFGSPVDSTFLVENLSRNEYMREILEKTGLTSRFVETGCKLAALKAEIFKDLPPGHEFFSRFSFISPEDIPAFEAILRSMKAKGIAALSEKDKEMLIGLPFRLVEAQHHVNLITEDLRERILTARRLFRDGLPDHLRGAIQFFDAGHYNSACSIIENIIFGKLASDKASSISEVSRMVSEVVDELQLRDSLTLIGLEYPVGVGAAHLTAAQKQKVALARCLLKRPDILIMSDALSTLDLEEQLEIIASVKLELQDRTLILFESDETHLRLFENALLMDQGKIVKHGETSEESGQQPSAAELAEMEAADNTRNGVDINEVVRMLLDIPLFREIPRSKLKLLAFTSERVRFEPGETVFRQGDPGDRAYLVLNGQAEVVLELGGSDKTVATLGRNEIFGELALLAKIPRTTSIRAKTPLMLLSFSRDVFMRLAEKNSEISSAMMRVLAERLAGTLEKYGKLVAADTGASPQDGM